MSNLFVLPRQTPVTAAGSIYSGAKAYFYRTGTSTPQDTYTDAAMGTPNANPVVADSGGLFGPIYLNTASYEYRVRLETSAGVLIYQQDNVGGKLTQDEFNALMATSTGVALIARTAAEIAAGVTPTDYTRQPGDFVRYGLAVAASAATNSTAINNAMLSNSNVFCNDPGTYVCSDVISVQSNQTVQLAQGVILQASTKLWGSGFIRIFSKSNVRWYGGVIDGNKAANPTGTLNGLMISDSTDVKIFGVTCKNCPSDNVTLGAAGDGFYVGGVTNPGSSRIALIGCTSDANVRQGLSIVRASGVEVIGCWFGNTTGNNPGGGIDIEADNVSYVLEDIHVIGCTITGCYFGVVFQQYCVNSTMSGCTISDCRFSHLYLSLCNRISVTGNVFDAQVAFDASAPIVDMIGASDVVFSGNYLRGANLTNQGAGVRCLQANNNIVIANNTFMQTRTQGVSVSFSAAATADNMIRVLGNSFIDCVYAGLASTAVIAVSCNSGSSIYPTLVFIQDNIIYDSRSGGDEADIGIDLSTNIPAATQQNYRVDRNVVMGPAAIYTAGAYQPGTGGVTWDPGNLVDGAGETSPDITVLGAVVGDRVEVYPPYAITDCICTGYVKSTDTVVIRLQNESGSANFNGASATWRVRVRKINEG